MHTPASLVWYSNTINRNNTNTWWMGAVWTLRTQQLWMSKLLRRGAHTEATQWFLSIYKRLVARCLLGCWSCVCEAYTEHGFVGQSGGRHINTDLCSSRGYSRTSSYQVWEPSCIFVDYTVLGVCTAVFSAVDWVIWNTKRSGESSNRSRQVAHIV